MRGGCPARDLEKAILPLMHVGIDEKELRKSLIKDEAAERIFHGRVLKYGKDIGEVKGDLQKHIPACEECTDIYDDFLWKEAENEFEFSQRDKKHLKLYQNPAE